MDIVVQVFSKAGLTVFFVLISCIAYGQLFSSYYYDYKLLNPALVGIKDKHTITSVYRGTPFDKYAVLYYGSYETSIPSIKSGIGGFGLHEWFHATEQIQAGLFYSKQLSFNGNSGLRLGTQLSYQAVNYDYSELKLLDNLEYYGGYERNEFNFDLGMQYYSSVIDVGVAVNDILIRNRTKRAWSVIASREINVSKWLTANPSLVYFASGEDFRFDINNVFEIKQLVLIGGGYSVQDGDDNISFSLGLNIKDYVQLVGHVYSKQIYEFRNYIDRRAELLVRANIPHRKHEN